MITIQQLIIQAVEELGLTSEQPSTNLNTPDCQALVAAAKRIIFAINRDWLYSKKSAAISLSNQKFDLDSLDYMVLDVQNVKINGKKHSFSIDSHVLAVKNCNNEEATITYIGCNKELISVTSDIGLPTYITKSLLVAGICYEYCRMKGLEYSIAYYEESWKKGIESVFKTRKSVVLPVRRFV